MDDRSLGEIESLYRRRFDAFVGAALRIVGDPELAREAVQEAFAGVVRSRRTFRGESALETWVWRAVINEARTMQQRAREEPRRVKLSSSANGSSGDAEVSRLAVAVAALPERQRLMLFLRYYADLDYRAIAELLEVEIGTVSATLHAAREHLRTMLAGVER